MRLSEWRANAPLAEAASDDVIARLEPLLADFGVPADPECWVAWGEDPAMRYSILVPSLAGLVSLVVRPMGSQDGPRASARLIRWSKLAVSELDVDSTGGHRIVAVQVESYVLKGTDDEADRIVQFVRGLIATIENRFPQPVSQLVAPGYVPPGYATSAGAGPTGGKAAGRGKAPKPTPGAGPASVPTGEPAGEPAETAAAGLALIAVAAKPPTGEPAPTEPARPEPAPAEPAGAQPIAEPARAPTSAPKAPPRMPGREEWVGPHPIVAPRQPQKKPRRWTP